MRKRINKVIALLAVLGILTGSGTVVYGNEENIADQEEQLTKEKESIYIDNTGCYEGMETSYSEGYVPEITENEVKIVLPPSVKGNLKEKKLHVHPDLGSATQAPYVYKNYDKDVVEEEKTISTGEVRKVYYVSILLQLKEEREAGTYPINWEVTGILENGETLMQTFSTYVNIDAKKNESSEDNPTDQEIPGTDTNEQNPGNIAVDGDTGGGSFVEHTGETVTEVKHNPKLLHIETKCNKKTVEPGDKIKLELTFQNKSKKETIRNVALRVGSNIENVAIRNKTNTWYFENIAPQEKITVKVSAQINLGVEGEFVDFNYTEQYDDKDGEQKEEAGTIAVTLTRLPKIQWEITALNDVVYAGDRIALSGNIMNVGQGKAYNVNVTMEVPGLHLEKTMFAGEVEKGTSAEIDSAVLVDGKPDKEKYGNTEGNFIITYTDETGKEYQDTLGVITEIQPPVIVTDTGTEDNSKRSMQWWMICFVSVECILVAAVYYFVKRRKKMKKKQYYMICLVTAIFFLMLFRDVRREYQNLRKGMEQQSVILLDVHPDAKNISKLKKYKGVQTASLLYRFQAETADGKINFQVLGSEELPGTDRQKEDLEDTILLPEKLEQELEESVVNNRRFLLRV